MKKAKWTSLVFLMTLVAFFMVSVPTPAEAAPEEEKVVYFMSWGGTVQRALEENGWAKKFEEKTGYKVVLTPKNTSAEIIAQAVAQKSNPQVDVVMCDAGPLMNGAQQGLFIDLDENAIPSMKDLMDTGKHGDHVYVYTSAAVMLYNKDYFQKNNIAPPDTWADLLRQEFRGKMFLPPITYTFGLYAIVELANMNGGGVHNIDPGFEKLAEVAPGVVDWPTSIGVYEQLFLSGEAIFGVDEWVDGITMRNKGLPVEIAIPKEGTYSSPAAAAIVKNAPHPRGAELFLDFLISEEFAQYWGEASGKGSFNTKVTYDPALLKDILTTEMMSQLKTFDWDTVNPVRNEWTERFNKIVGK